MSNRTILEIEASSKKLHHRMKPLFRINLNDAKNYVEKYENVRIRFLKMITHDSFYDQMMGGVTFDGIHEFSKWYYAENLVIKMPEAIGFLLAVLDYGLLRVPPNYSGYKEYVNDFIREFKQLREQLRRRPDVVTQIEAHWTRLLAIKELEPQKELLERLIKLNK